MMAVDHVSMSVLYFSKSPLWLRYDGCSSDGGTGNELDSAAGPASLPSEFTSTAKVLNVSLPTAACFLMISFYCF